MAKNSGYWNRPDPKGFQMPVRYLRPGAFTPEEKKKCLDDVYNQCKATRPDLTPEQFIDDLANGRILITLPDGEKIYFETTHIEDGASDV